MVGQAQVNFIDLNNEGGVCVIEEPVQGTMQYKTCILSTEVQPCALIISTGINA